MSSLTPAFTLRLAKALLVGGLGLFFAVVAFNNATDYGTNFAFVEHVLKMDTLPEGQSLRWRALDSPTIHHLFYVGIIVWEAAVSLLCLTGAWQGLHTLKTNTAFTHAKTRMVLGLTASALLWLVAFLTVGGEWFVMWLSNGWNGQAPASRMLLVSLALLILVAQPEGE